MTIPHTSTYGPDTTPQPSVVVVPCVEVDGFEIVNPFMSECGRFEVYPGIYGFAPGKDGAYAYTFDDGWTIVARRSTRRDVLDGESVVVPVFVSMLFAPGALPGDEPAVTAVSTFDDPFNFKNEG